MSKLNLELELKDYFGTGIFYIPKVLFKFHNLKTRKRYKLIIEEVE